MFSIVVVFLYGQWSRMMMLFIVRICFKKENRCCNETFNKKKKKEVLVNLNFTKVALNVVDSIVSTTFEIVI